MRKGPEHLPDSVLVLLVAVALFTLAMLVSEALADATGTGALLESVVVSIAGYFLYWIVLLVTGFGHRLVPTVASIMACGSILTIAMVMTFVILEPLLGPETAALLAWLVLIWSVPVKGHIIARAIGQHWYVGIAIALAVYVLQRFAYDALTNTAAG